MKKTYIIALLGLLTFNSCKKDEEIPLLPVDTILELKFLNKVGNQDIELNNGRYLNPNNDTFSINGFKYIVSNIKLYNGENLVYTENNSYHLIDERLEETHSILLKDVPVGTYDKIVLSMGVDAAHDNSSSGDGDLSSNNGLFWSGWGSYIYCRFDGTFHKDTSIALSFHAGGSTTYAVYDLDLQLNPVIISTGKTASIYVNTDINEMFGNPNVFDFEKIRNIAAQGTSMDSLGANLQSGLFGIDRVLNP